MCVLLGGYALKIERIHSLKDLPLEVLLGCLEKQDYADKLVFQLELKWGNEQRESHKKRESFVVLLVVV